MAHRLEQLGSGWPHRQTIRLQVRPWGAGGLIALLLLIVPVALRTQTPYRVGPPPAWVKTIRADLTAPPPHGTVTGGYELLLVDRQEAPRPTGLERFRHITYRLLDEGAVQENSQLELVFNPAYEQLTLHAVTVTRNGRVVDQLKRARIRAVKRESEMDYQIFDGSLSLVLVLEDVKKGDVVDYSYTRQGANPVFAGHYMGAVSLQETVPVRALYFRLVWPHDRPLFVRRHDTAAEPVITAVGPYQEHVWTARDVPPKVLDADLPGWFDPFPGLQLSDFASWAQVAAWGDALFASHDPVPRAVAARLARIRAAYASKPNQVLEALRFVQDEVRYVGVEIGINSHVPYPPATVMRRGYGDCKDKVLLLVTMLRELGVSAWPALVSTTYGRYMRDFHPTPAHFDHAIVQAEVDGQIYWLDPTALYQRGDLLSAAPRFGAALVLGRGSDSLSTIPEPSAADPITEIAVSFQLADVGKPATMGVETRYRGRTADTFRARTRAISPEKLQKEFTDFYAEAYPGLRSETLPSVHDDEAANVIHTSERYTIPAFWHPAASEPGYLATLDPVELDRALPSPTASGRTMPLAVDHPVHYRYTITARIPDGWGVKARADTIVTPAMRFARGIEVQDQALTLNYEYETLADHVDPGAVAEHLEKLSHMRRLLPFSVTPPKTASWSDPRELNWSVLLAGLFVTGLAVFGAVRLSRSPPPGWPAGPRTPDQGPSGLGGWLIFVGLGVCFTPLTIVSVLVQGAPSYTASVWAQLTTPGTAKYHALWAPSLLLELVGNLALLVFACLQVWLFFRRKRWFPGLFVMLAVARVIFEWTDALLANGIPTIRARGVHWAQHETTLLVFALWVGYMFRSRRVQNTFVN
jgi:transglutaminase-like putative cysteine protease